MMETGIDPNIPLDYVEFHIVPSQNRYEACVCYENEKEKVTSGVLEHLLMHSVAIKALQSKGSSGKYRFYPPEGSHDIKWFTRSTLTRFLHIIGSANLLDNTNSLKDEISQLEEARRFHLSLYAKGREYHIQTGESDDSCTNGMGSTVKAEGSDASKNELLQAMDLRLAALREELTTAFDQATGCRYSVEEMTDIEKFSQHFGSGDLSDSLRKYIELIHGAKAVERSGSEHFSESDRVKSKGGNSYTSKPISSEKQVKYGVSPAKVAQIERQSSTESDESSFSSEEEQPSAERSRTLMRSASPRRSASPMRRIQIGRSGSRRSTAITIKSLNCFPAPARERLFLPKDPASNDSDEEESEQARKKSENNARRMSVQDAISLFESKQKDQTGDIQKARSLLNASIGANKSVLRRWSSGTGEDSSRCPQDTLAEDVTVKEIQNNVETTEAEDVTFKEIQSNVETTEVTYSSPEPGVTSEDKPVEPCGTDVKLNSPEKEGCNLVDETCPTDASEKQVASAEWSRQKEAELNELLMKMMETKPAKSRTVVPASSKRQSLPSQKRGGFYDHYKEKRDEKLRGEAARKRADKDNQFRASQKVLDAKKSQVTSANANDASRKHNVKKLQKPQNTACQPANSKAESPRLGIVKKPSPRTSSLPATRKSWPSMPSVRAPGSSPAKTPVSSDPKERRTPATILSTGATPTPRRSQPTPPISQASPKVETSQMPAKSVKSYQNDSKKIQKHATEKKQQTVTKQKKTAKSNIQTAPEVLVSSAKSNLYTKATKKSSVVPLESKPFLRKGSGTASNVNPAVKKKPSSPPEPLMKSEDLTLGNENLTVFNSSDLVIQQEEREIEELKNHTGVESETNTRSPQQCEDQEGLSEDREVNPSTDDGADRVQHPELKADEAEEESSISPTAWVEIDEHEDQSITSGDHSCQIVRSPAYKAAVEVSSPRVRHSLSQMLLEESSEPDVIDWGNAENPPAMVYHKDSPKGLKRLLKFARKSKTETNGTGWSSPSVFSEGEDDADDSKFVSKRSSENLLRIATHQSKNNGHQKNSTDHEHPALANTRKLNAQSLSPHFQEANVSASVTTTKATRSFFSLSAFKGSK